MCGAMDGGAQAAQGRLEAFFGSSYPLTCRRQTEGPGSARDQIAIGALIPGHGSYPSNSKSSNSYSKIDEGFRLITS